MLALETAVYSQSFYGQFVWPYIASESGEIALPEEQATKDQLFSYNDYLANYTWPFYSAPRKSIYQFQDMQTQILSNIGATTWVWAGDLSKHLLRQAKLRQWMKQMKSFLSCLGVRGGKPFTISNDKKSSTIATTVLDKIRIIKHLDVLSAWGKGDFAIYASDMNALWVTPASFTLNLSKAMAFDTESSGICVPGREPLQKDNNAASAAAACSDWASFYYWNTSGYWWKSMYSCEYRAYGSPPLSVEYRWDNKAGFNAQGIVAYDDSKNPVITWAFTGESWRASGTATMPSEPTPSNWTFGLWLSSSSEDIDVSSLLNAFISQPSNSGNADSAQYYTYIYMSGFLYTGLAYNPGPSWTWEDTDAIHQTALDDTKYRVATVTYPALTSTSPNSYILNYCKDEHDAFITLTGSTIVKDFAILPNTTMMEYITTNPAPTAPTPTNTTYKDKYATNGKCRRVIQQVLNTDALLAGTAAPSLFVELTGYLSSHVGQWIGVYDHRPYLVYK